MKKDFLHNNSDLLQAENLKLSAMAAVSKNGVIGSGPDIPWHVRGEQLLFKALTYNQWLLVGRKTFESMGKLPDRKYAVITRNPPQSDDADVMYFSDIDIAIEELSGITEHVMVAGGGQIYQALIERVDVLHLSVIDTVRNGDIVFPDLPEHLEMVFTQEFNSNMNYSYQIWQSRTVHESEQHSELL